MVAKFTIAARQAKVQGQDPPALWFTVEVWGQTASWIADNLRKGEGAFVSGQLALQQWTDRETGEVREALTVKNARVEKLWAPQGAQGAQGSQGAQGAAPAAAPAQPAYQQAPLAAAPAHRAAPAPAPVPAAAPFNDEPPF